MEEWPKLHTKLCYGIVGGGGLAVVGWVYRRGEGGAFMGGGWVYWVGFLGAIRYTCYQNFGCFIELNDVVLSYIIIIIHGQNQSHCQTKLYCLFDFNCNYNKPWP